MTIAPDFDFTLPGETWRAVPSLTGCYVSDHGRLASYRPPSTRGRTIGWKRLMNPKPAAGGFIRTGFVRDGYNRYLHHLVADAFLPERPTPEHEIAFLDEDPSNCRPENLTWLTVSARNAKRFATGSWTPDQFIRNDVLTEDDVRQVRQLMAAGATQTGIAKKFGVSRAAIYHIKVGNCWSHVA